MSPLQILHERASDSLMIITIIGQMDESNIDQQAPEVYGLIEQIPQGGGLILNFSGLEYMNSKSIGYTMDFFNKITEKQGHCIIAEAPDQIVDILEVVGIAQVIPMVGSIQEAKNLIAQESGEAPAAPTSTPAATPTPVQEEPKAEETPAPVMETSPEPVVEPEVPTAPKMTDPTASTEPHTASNEELQSVKEVVESSTAEPEAPETPAAAETPTQEEPKVEDPENSAEETPAPATPEKEEEGLPILGIAVVVAVIVIVIAVIF